MLDSIGEGALLACPVALTCASVVVADRLRDRRRRAGLNRALHELRRPLQALALEAGAPTPSPRRGRDQLTQALAALDDVDRELNRRPADRRSAPVDGRALAADAVGRWRGPVALEVDRVHREVAALGARAVAHVASPYSAWPC